MAQHKFLNMMGALMAAQAVGGVLAQATPAPSTPVSTPAVTTATPAPVNADALESARAALNAGRLREAQVKFEALVAADFGNVEAHFGLGLALYALGDFTGARFEFQQLVKLAPERVEGHYNLGVVAARSGNSDEALVNFGKALEVARGKTAPATLRQLLDAVAAEQGRKADFAGLSKTLEEALALSPQDDALRLRLAEATFRAGNGLDALPLAYTVLQRQRANVNAALLVAEVYAAQNLPERAARELDKVASVAPPKARATLLVRKAELLRASDKPKEAADALRTAIKADPSNARAVASLGELLFSRGDRGGALSAWQTALKLEPKNTLFRANLASVQLAVGQTDAARENALIVQRDAVDAATSARAQFVLGVAAYRQGNHAQARSALQAASLKSPSAETYLWLGLSEYALKDYAGAVTALEASVKSAPEMTARTSLGAALLAAGRYPEAEATLRGVVTDAPKNGEAWYNLGWSMRSQGREADARVAFKKSLGLGYAKAEGALR
ncbi:tetratricopeptide repeat protein [Deinococcus peraridilitoris]|uniref:Tfp pilus assembly protein PilF n=1 Tax=Deinococcus peraridilitoris (strain DSM 19664 / LMG 22246 / CIP 109416 / KR-200) TaxID=937777 RepID=L0A526_DEIPD|nr:tetratricopeptide repeat protein [Deinococcus peraridilitoris]AFZ68971.1 Tfp pilus assembly protein PilF [Deinococcus peraridilitoris DSM 19664]